MSDQISPDDSIALGQSAAEIAATALVDLGREMIRQKALDIARQIEIYLESKEFHTLEELKQDPALASIAVRTIWRSGYSAVHDTRGFNVFHSKPGMAGTDLRRLAERFPQFWEIIQRSFTEETDGYYDWEEGDGEIHRKYMYCVVIHPRQIAPLGLIAATTISIDEFLQPSREISQRIITLAERVDAYTRAEQRRIHQLKAINEFSRTISSFLSINDLMPFVVNTLHTSFQFDSVRIFLLRKGSHRAELAAVAGERIAQLEKEAADGYGGSVIEWVATTGKPHLSGDCTASMEPAQPTGGGQCSRMTLPIKIGNVILGVLDINNRDLRGFAGIDVVTIWPLADQVAIAMENSRLHNELREMAVVNERNRIAREIHDTLAQGFAGISMLVESTKQAVRDQDLVHAEELLDRTRNLAREKLKDARDSVQSLRPCVEIEEELEALIQYDLDQLTNDMHISTQLDVTGEWQALNPSVKMAVLRICQEALNNVKKHARAQLVKVGLAYSPGGVSLVVQDDGIGFDPRIPSANHFGLTFMTERARLVGGSLVVNSEAGKGTEIAVNIPV